MKKLTPSQEKIIVIAVLVLTAFLIFWIFFYLPNRNKVKQIRADLLNVEGQLREIEAITGKTDTIDQGLQLLMKRYQELKSKFPQKEEDSLRTLSYLTRKLNIEIISIEPRPKVALKDKRNKPVEIEGKTCQRIPVSIGMRCFYQDLVKYIETLYETFPTFITIEKVQAYRGKANIPRLDIKLELSLYFLM